MNRLLTYAITMSIHVIAFGVTGCSLPTIQDGLDSIVGTQFSNPTNPNRNRITNHSYRRVQLKEGANVYYQKEPEGPNTRYYISAWGSTYTDCRYSLLVSQEDIILSWRNEGPKHVSKCQHN